MAGVSNIRKLNTVRFKTEKMMCYIQYENVEELQIWMCSLSMTSR